MVDSIRPCMFCDRMTSDSFMCRDCRLAGEVVIQDGEAFAERIISMIGDTPVHELDVLRFAKCSDFERLVIGHAIEQGEAATLSEALNIVDRVRQRRSERPVTR